MMKTMIAIEVITDGDGDNEISNDDNDDSDSNNKDYVYTRQFFDLMRAKEDRLHPAGPNGVYPSLPKFTLADHKSDLIALCPHKTAQNGPDCSSPKENFCFLSTRGGFEGPNEVRPHNRASDLPQFFLRE